MPAMRVTSHTTMPVLTAIGALHARATTQPSASAMRNGATTFSVPVTSDPDSSWFLRPMTTSATTGAMSMPTAMASRRAAPGSVIGEEPAQLAAVEQQRVGVVLRLAVLQFQHPAEHEVVVAGIDDAFDRAIDPRDRAVDDR